MGKDATAEPFRLQSDHQHELRGLFDPVARKILKIEAVNGYTHTISPAEPQVALAVEDGLRQQLAARAAWDEVEAARAEMKRLSVPGFDDQKNLGLVPVKTLELSYLSMTEVLSAKAQSNFGQALRDLEKQMGEKNYDGHGLKESLRRNAQENNAGYLKR